VRGVHASEDDETIVDVVWVGADHFTAVDVRLVRGRPISAEDVEQGRRVAIVNETMARLFWPGGGVLGERVYTSGFESEPYEIVGIARDHKVRSVGESFRPYLHLPAGRSSAIGLVVRTTAPAESALLGVALGALGAAVVGRLLESLLYGVSGFDPLAYGAAAGVLLLVACAANLGPAFAAARVDPLRALRSE